MKYYKEHYQEYIESTLSNDMIDNYQMVEKYLHKGDCILDVGFGSARDMLYFQNQGYQVYGIDIEDGFISHAKSLHLNVEKQDIRTYKSDERFHLIYCSASLLHLKRDEIIPTIKRLMTHLEKDGIFFLSVKYSEKEDGYDEKGRYFTYFHQRDIDALPFRYIEETITEDKNRENLKWINLVLKNETDPQ